MTSVRRSTALLHQPLLHFVVLGALLFALYAWRAPDDEMAGDGGDGMSRRIVVDRAALLEYMQYQASIFEPGLFEERLATMSADEVRVLASDYAREEALFREALRIGMDAGDYVIRQRLVQKVEFLLENLAAGDAAPSAEELGAFFSDRREDYRADAVYTFTHIFFDAQQGGLEEARTRAQRLLASMPDMTFDEADRQGDRFPFLQDYTGRTRNFVVNNFGMEFASALDAAEVDQDTWQGPFASRYGQHLVLLRSRSEPFIPDFDEIRERVIDDYRYEALVRSRQAAEDRVVAEYDIILELP